MKARRTFHREFKLSLCRDVEEGRISKPRACREHDLSPSVLDRWVERHRRLGDEAFSGGSGFQEPSPEARTRDLEALVGRQALEIEFLKAAIKKGDLLREKKPR